MADPALSLSSPGIGDAPSWTLCLRGPQRAHWNTCSFSSFVNPNWGVCELGAENCQNCQELFLEFLVLRIFIKFEEKNHLHFTGYSDKWNKVDTTLICVNDYMQSHYKLRSPYFPPSKRNHYFSLSGIPGMIMGYLGWSWPCCEVKAVPPCKVNIITDTQRSSVTCSQPCSWHFTEPGFKRESFWFKRYFQWAYQVKSQ